MDAHGAHYSSFDWPNQSTTRNRFMGSPPRGAGNGSAKGKSNGAHGVGSTPPPSASSMVSQTAPTQRATSASPGSLASSPSRPVSPPQLGLLVPTDRPLDEFEDKWLPRLGRLRVDREVHMKGYALYGIRGW